MSEKESNIKLRAIKSLFVPTEGENEPEGTIYGCASVYDVVDDYGDIIRQGAYDDVLSSGELPKMFFNHLSYNSVPIGIWTKMWSDAKGLWVKGCINLELEKGREVYSAIKQGAVDGLSVCIDVSESELDSYKNRIITDVVLVPEISICTFPANHDARLTDVKSKLEKSKTLSDYEKILRDAGLSKSEATAFVSSVKKSVLLERDASNKIDELYSLIVSIGSHKNG